MCVCVCVCAAWLDLCFEVIWLRLEWVEGGLEWICVNQSAGYCSGPAERGQFLAEGRKILKYSSLNRHWKKGSRRTSMALALGTGWLVPCLHWEQEQWKRSRCGVKTHSLENVEEELSKKRCEIDRRIGLELRRTIRAEHVTNPRAWVPLQRS